MKAISIRRAVLVVIAAGCLAFPVQSNAADTSNFTQVINAGTLTINIVDASYANVVSPTVAMGAVTFSVACQTATGTFGTSGQRIYIQNPDAADNGWTASMAANAATALWDSAGTDYDFNDPTGTGCTDGGDADAFGGQMTVNPVAGTVFTGQCGSCTTGNITKGSATAFNQGTTDSITLLTAAAASDDVGDWYFTGVGISQTIPAEQPPAADYDINMVVSIVAT